MDENRTRESSLPRPTQSGSMVGLRDKPCSCPHRRLIVLLSVRHVQDCHCWTASLPRFVEDSSGQVAISADQCQQRAEYSSMKHGVAGCLDVCAVPMSHLRKELSHNSATRSRSTTASQVTRSCIVPKGRRHVRCASQAAAAIASKRRR